MDNIRSYGTLCSLFYDATKAYASSEEVNFYAQFMSTNGRVLEAMCGSGRLLIPLQERGLNIDGVDNSSAMLRRCEVRAHERGFQVNVFKQSLEKLALPHTYQTVTIALGSFQLITDRSHALNALRELNRVMEMGGDLLIDTFVPSLQKGSSSKAVRIDDHRVLTLTTEYTYHHEDIRADARCTYELFMDGTLIESEQELIQVTWYTDTEFKELLSQAGFKFIRQYTENFPVTGHCNIVHARKAGV